MFATAKSADLRSSNHGARHFGKVVRRALAFCGFAGNGSVICRTNRTVGCPMALNFAQRCVANAASDAAERRVAVRVRRSNRKSSSPLHKPQKNPAMPHRAVSPAQLT
jgi:hypothetical protein